MKRIFIAVNLPLEIKKQLAELEETIKSAFPDEIRDRVAKWVRPENLHITLLFIGEVRDEELIQIIETVRAAVRGWQSFEVKFKKVCYGPAKAMPPRLIWLETERNKDLECLAESLGQAMLKNGILRQLENRPFAGHITLARLNVWVWRKIEPEERPEITQELNRAFPVNSIDIMESALKRTGPEYIILKSEKLE